MTAREAKGRLLRQQGIRAARRRIRRPFRTAPRRPTLSEVVALLRRLYGPQVPYFPSSPYVDTRWDPAELILHELAHATQLDREVLIRRGGMGPSWERMNARLFEDDRRALADRHEVRTIAIEIGVARRLRLPFDPARLLSSGGKNCRCWDLAKDYKRFGRNVARASRTPAVWFGIQYVLDLLDAEWLRFLEELRCNAQPCLPSSRT